MFPDISELHSLTELRLNNNKIQNIPKNISNNAFLRTLNLSCNCLYLQKYKIEFSFSFLLSLFCYFFLSFFPLFLLVIIILFKQHREIEHLSPLKHLTQLDLHDNPLTKDEESYKALIKKNCTHLYLLDNVLIKKKSVPKNDAATIQQQSAAGDANEKRPQQKTAEHPSKKRRMDTSVGQDKKRPNKGGKFRGKDVTSKKEKTSRNITGNVSKTAKEMPSNQSTEHEPTVNLFDKKAKEMQKQKTVDDRISEKHTPEAKDEAMNKTAQPKKFSKASQSEEKESEFKETVKLLPTKMISKSDLIAELQRQYDQAYSVNSW